jgi:hypothetical protein
MLISFVGGQIVYHFCIRFVVFVSNQVQTLPKPKSKKSCVHKRKQGEANRNNSQFRITATTMPMNAAMVTVN